MWQPGSRFEREKTRALSFGRTLDDRCAGAAKGGEVARGRRRGARLGNSNDVDRVARRETPVGVSSGSEEGWKREYDWFVRVAIHGGRRCRLESALFLDPERSISLAFSRETRKESGRGRWNTEEVEDSLFETYGARRERERLGNKGEKRKMEDEGGRGGSWRTNRRSLTDVATPYVTFIADALLRHLLIPFRTL